METKNASADMQNEKVIAMLAYFIFFLPLLVAKTSKFAMFHANQAFNLFLLSLAVTVIGSVIPILGWFLVGPLGTIFCIVLLVLGIINALNGVEKELPVIGKYSILKLK